MQLYIKNMVCHRCKMMVKTELKKAHIDALNISLGEITVAEMPSKSQLTGLSAGLQKLGFALIDDKESRLIEKVKTFIIQAVHYDQQPPVRKFSVLIAQHLQHDYSFVSKLFSEVEGITIEHYIIHQKIEKVKELMMYAELSLSQIAAQMGYSSTAHLSAQFKKITGINPSAFKNGSAGKRKSLDDVG